VALTIKRQFNFKVVNSTDSSGELDMAEKLGGNTVVQVGFIVRDIEKSIDAFTEVFGLEQRPGVNETASVETTNLRYSGQPSNGRAKLAFIPMGQVTIELIQPIGGPSTWQEFLDAHGEGVHHLAFMVEGTDRVVQVLQGQGIPVVQQGDYTGGRYTYLDSQEKLGVLLELLENFR
jgi:methylmalonyl-CoA/ethylmalonyl-CoA epimerase